MSRHESPDLPLFVRPASPPSMDDPCPHPVRDGIHEIYILGTQASCRACGAHGSLDAYRTGTPTRPPKALSRASDPLSSHEAADTLAESGQLGRMMRVTLEMLMAYPGRTVRELETRAGVENGVYRKRLNDLRVASMARTGDPRRCRVTGRTVATWWAV